MTNFSSRCTYVLLAMALLLTAIVSLPAVAAAQPAVERVVVGAYSGLSAGATPVDPCTKKVGDTLAVYVEAVNAIQLQGVDFLLEYSRDTLEVDAYTDPSGNQVSLIYLGDIRDVPADSGTLDADAGTISVGVANQNAADYARAVLLKVQFKIKAEGNRYVRIRTGSLQLTGPGGVLINPGAVEDLTCVIPPPPAEETVLIINAPDDCIPVGGQFTVAVEVKNVENMYGADVRLNFDPYFLEVVGEPEINTDGVFSLGGTTTVDNQVGYVAFNASRNRDEYGYEGYYGDAVLAWITFKAKEPTREGTCINFLSAELVGNEDGEGSPVYNIPVNNWINDCVCISGYVLGGRVIPEAMSLRCEPYYMDYSGTKVYLEGTSLVTYTDAEGNYSFTNPPPGVYNLVAEREGYLTRAVEGVSVDGVNGANVNLLLLTGDITRDNAVDIDDLNVMRTDYDTRWNIRSDLDYSGWVGIRDLVYLARNYTKYGYGYPLP